MKIRVYSDIHIDHYFANGVPLDANTGEVKCWAPPVLPDDKETTLILAGDLWTGTRFIEFAGYSWITEVSTRFKNVLIVLGNHDYWPGNNALTILGGGDTCNAMLQDFGCYNVKVLDCDTWADGEYLFVGCTLWTDMNSNNALSMYNMPRFMAYDGKCAYDTGPNGQWTRFTSEKWVQTHAKHRAYIKQIAEQNRDKKIVVITHHLPLLFLGDPRYQGDKSNHYYMSDLSDVILDNEHIVMWIYGHTHYQNDVMFPSSSGYDGCRMLNNSVGYVSEGHELSKKVKHEIIKLGE